MIKEDLVASHGYNPITVEFKYLPKIELAMKTSELLQKIEQNFSEKLELKTGWGRNEIKAVYQSSVIEILAGLTNNLIEDDKK